MKKSQKKRKAKAARQLRVIAVEAQEEEPIFELSEAAMKKMEGMGMSHDDIRQSLRDSVRAEMPEEDGHYCWIETVYDAAFVYEAVSPDARQLYRRDYSMDEAGNMTMGDPQPVKKVVSYEPMEMAGKPAMVEESGAVELFESASELGGPIPLIEAKVRADGTLPILLINEGWGSSGYYSREVLERDAGAFPKGTQMHLDHMTRAEEAEKPEGSVLTMAAVLDADAYFKEDGPGGPGLYADAKVLDHQKQLVEALAPYVGLSIRADGIARHGEAEGRKGPIVEKIVKGRRVDFVTMAGRGGKVLEIMESARASHPQEPKDSNQIKESKMAEIDDKELQGLREAAAENETTKQQNARLSEALILREAADVVAEVLTRTDYAEVPDMTLARVKEAQAKNPPVKDGALDKDALITRVVEAIKAEVQYLAELTGSGQVRGMGGGSTQISESGQSTEAQTSQMEEGFKRLGLSESAAKHAAAGRR